MKSDIPIVSAAYEARRARRNESQAQEIWALLDQVCDPEIPVLSLWDLGVLSDIEHSENGVLVLVWND